MRLDLNRLCFFLLIFFFIAECECLRLLGMPPLKIVQKVTNVLQCYETDRSLLVIVTCHSPPYIASVGVRFGTDSLQLHKDDHVECTKLNMVRITRPATRGICCNVATNTRQVQSTFNDFDSNEVSTSSVI
jgi:hypothetical protein